MKKLDMADAAEQLLATTSWLPALLRTPKPDQERVGETPNEQTGATYSAAAE
jgi:ParB family chromosome partitioning protein